MTEMTIKVDVEVGAGGTDFAAKVLDEIETDGNVYIQVAGEYGHLRITALRDFEVTA